METAEFIETLRREGPLLADTVHRAGLDAPVPTCPDWQARDLVRHTGAVHRWATGFVAEGHPAPVEFDESAPGDAELLAWYRDLHGRLADALTAAPADLDCWTFLPAPTPLAFWARRQAHETTVHRIDAQAALGRDPSPVEAAFAADGVDELLLRFQVRASRRVRVDQPRTLRVRTDDVPGDGWLVHFLPQASRVEPGGTGAADCEVAGPAADVYPALWNRRPFDGLSVRGDASVLELWQRASAAI